MTDDDFTSVDSKGLNYQDCEIAGGVQHVGKDDLDVGAGDQVIMSRYASDETEDAMSHTHTPWQHVGETSGPTCARMEIFRGYAATARLE